MLRSLMNIIHLNPGFQQVHVLTARLSLPHEEYKTDEATTHFFELLLTNLKALPGVQNVGLGSDLPWTGYDENTSFSIEGKVAPPHQEFHARYHMAASDYFRALGVPLLKGRFFEEGDKDGAPTVVLINHALAEKYWPGEDAVGKRMTFEDKPKEKDWLTVIGVVGRRKRPARQTGRRTGVLVVGQVRLLSGMFHWSFAPTLTRC